MLEHLKDRITDEQVDVIVQVIMEQLLKYSAVEEVTEYLALYRDEYKSHRKAQDISFVIYSAFPSDTTIVENIKITNYSYGKGWRMPEFSNDKLVMHIFPSTAKLNAKHLEKYYAKNIEGFSGKQLYAYILYKIEKKNDRETIGQISLCLPDCTGKVVEEEILKKPEKVLALLKLPTSALTGAPT